MKKAAFAWPSCCECQAGRRAGRKAGRVGRRHDVTAEVSTETKERFSWGHMSSRWSDLDFLPQLQGKPPLTCINSHHQQLISPTHTHTHTPGVFKLTWLKARPNMAVSWVTFPKPPRQPLSKILNFITAPMFLTALVSDFVRKSKQASGATRTATWNKWAETFVCKWASLMTSSGGQK